MATDLKDKLATRQQAVAAAPASEQKTVLQLLGMDSVKRQLANALPNGITPERFLRVVLTEVRQNPALLGTTRESFLSSLMDAAALGLEPGPLGHAYLVPYRNNKTNAVDCTLILGYKGLIDLARRSGNIVSIVARAVHENDEFDFHYGDEERVIHKPQIRGDRGPAYAYYGVAHYRDGGKTVLVMSKEDVEKYRKRSKAKDSGPWVTDYDAMACKTVIRRMATFMPLSIQAAEAIQKDEARELGFEKEVADLGILEGQAIDVTEQHAQDAADAGKAAAVVDGTGEVVAEAEETKQVEELLALLADVPKEARWSTAVFHGKFSRGYETCRTEIIELRRQHDVEPVDPADAEGLLNEGAE